AARLQGLAPCRVGQLRGAGAPRAAAPVARPRRDGVRPVVQQARDHPPHDLLEVGRRRRHLALRAPHGYRPRPAPAPLPAGAPIGTVLPRASWGFAITCTAATSPTRPAAAAPASVAALTAATSPRTIAVTRP